MVSPPWLVVAVREFLERVRTRWFIVVTLLGPVLMVASVVLPVIIAERDAHREVKLALKSNADEKLTAGTVDKLLKSDRQLRIERVEARVSDDELLERIKRKEIVGFVILPKDLLHGEPVLYRGANATNFGAMALLNRGLHNAAVAARAEALGLTVAQTEGLLRDVPLQTTHTTGDKEGSSGAAAFILGYSVMFILYMAILLYAVSVMRSVIQEKTSRVVEIIVSSVKPMSLMAGKIGGVGSVGLLQLGLWVAMAAVVMKYRVALLAQFGAPGADLQMPPVGAGTIALILAYFLLGYFFYSALYAAIGAMCNSDQEAQQAQTPLVMLLIIPVACVQVIANDPRGTAASVMTQIPFASPVLMPMRWLLGGATNGEVAQSLAILVASLVLAVFVASRIYRVGILAYGKRPSLPELWRWIRQ